MNNNEQMTLEQARPFLRGFAVTHCDQDSALREAIDVLLAATAPRPIDDEALARLIVRHEGDAMQAMCIRIEKMLCEKLGREWSPSGMSVESLIDDLARHAASVGVQPSTDVEQKSDGWVLVESYRKQVRQLHEIADAKDARIADLERQLAEKPSTASAAAQGPSDEQIEKVIASIGMSESRPLGMQWDSVYKLVRHFAQQPASAAQGEPVATVQCINGVTIGYLEVMQPVGTKLYLAPPPAAGREVPEEGA